MKNTVKKAAALLLCAAMLIPLAACGENPNTQAHRQLFAMDTVMTLTAYGNNGEDGIAEAAELIGSYEALLDPENETSAVYALNSARGETVETDSQILEMLRSALTVYDRTGGALDLSVYPLSKLWGFIDLSESGGYVPTRAEIDALSEKLCFGEIEIEGQAVTVPDGAELSFGSVAKGATSNAVIDTLRAAGVTAAIVSLGGNVQTLGRKPDGTPWNVAVEDPRDTSAYAGVLAVGESAVITSGSYQRYFEADGVRYHHIIDPHTGCPAESGLLSVTIVCPDGLMADCLSTALFVLGEDAALDYYRSYGGFEMIMITEDNRLICTRGLEEAYTPATEKYEISYVD